jgi:tetratricopeptide (TPR) repeat protein
MGRLLQMLSLVTSLTLPALAREPKPEARAAWADGLHLYEAGDYPGALARFKRAYEIEPAPLLLFDIGQAYRLQMDDGHAAEAYREYLRVAPAAPNRADVVVLLEQTSSRLRRAFDSQLRRPSGMSQAPESPTTQPPTTQPPTTQPTPMPAAPRLTAHGRAELIAGLVLVGVGAAGVGTGGYFAWRRASDAARIEALRGDHGTWDARAQATWDDGVASSAAANALFVGGAALAVGGTILAVVGARSRATAHAWSLAPIRGGAAASWECAF